MKEMFSHLWTFRDARGQNLHLMGIADAKGHRSMPIGTGWVRVSWKKLITKTTGWMAEAQSIKQTKMVMADIGTN